MNKRKFSTSLDVYNLADSDNENVRDLNATKWRKDDIKSKCVENVHVKTGEWNLHHVRMVGASTLRSLGTSPSAVHGAW